MFKVSHHKRRRSAKNILPTFRCIFLCFHPTTNTKKKTICEQNKAQEKRSRFSFKLIHLIYFGGSYTIQPFNYNKWNEAFINLNKRLLWIYGAIIHFFQMRYTKKVSMWPVGLITKFGVSTPIVKNGVLHGFYDGWIGGRKFAVDMAGFAVSVKFLLDRPKALMPFKPGYEEDGFLKSLSPLNVTEIELLASNCTEVTFSRVQINSFLFKARIILFRF